MPEPVEPITGLFADMTMPVLVSLLLVVPVLLFARWVKERYQQVLEYFSQVPLSSGLTGFEVGQRLLQHAGLEGVRVLPATGARMRNQYHPFTREITLTHPIYTSNSLAALAIAAHEVGHAVQFARGYLLARLRTALVPMTGVFLLMGIGTSLFGIVEQSRGLMCTSAGLFAGCLLFCLVTLGFEFDASARARVLALAAGILRPEEQAGMDSVLRSAALTYVGWAVQGGFGVLGLCLVLGLWQFGAPRDADLGFAELWFWLPVLLQVLTVMFLITYRKRASSGRSAPQAIELNNTGTLLGEQGDLAGAIDYYTRAIQLDPNLVQAYSNRGTSYARVGRLDDALADLNRAMRLAPTAAGPRLTRAQILTMRKDYAAALDDLDEAFRLVPENLATIRFHQGNVWFDMGHYDRAIAVFTEALSQGGHWPLARCNRGLAFLRKGDLPRALADCDEAIHLAPNEAIAYNNRGVVLMNLGNWARALTDLRTANRLDPQHPNALKNLAWLQATCPDALFRNGPEAIANATRAMQRAGDHGREWLDILAAAHAEAGQFDLAVRYQEQVLSRCAPSSRAEQQARLDLYRAGQPYREQTNFTVVSRSCQ
jgi:Zn-dependent membrane protease YugP/Flp pilus assembly protein TadD